MPLLCCVYRMGEVVVGVTVASRGSVRGSGRSGGDEGKRPKVVVNRW